MKGSRPCQVEWAAGAAGREATEQSSSTGSVKEKSEKVGESRVKVSFWIFACFFVWCWYVVSLFGFLLVSKDTQGASHLATCVFSRWAMKGMRLERRWPQPTTSTYGWWGEALMGKVFFFFGKTWAIWFHNMLDNWKSENECVESKWSQRMRKKRSYSWKLCRECLPFWSIFVCF